MNKSDIQPKIHDGIPLCTYEDCASYDGKRCEMLGCRPSRVCEPQVAMMAEAIKQAVCQLDYLQNLWGAEGVTRTVTDRLKESIGDTP